MTISADEAKALLDAAGGAVYVKGYMENMQLIAAAPDLAATVIELSERIDKVAFFHPTTHGKPCGICEALGRYDEALTQGGEQ